MGSVADIKPVPANHDVDDRGRFIEKQVGPVWCGGLDWIR